jgi:hypothetical protein
MEGDGLGDLATLFLLRHVLVLDPLEPVAGNLPACLLHRLNLVRRTRHRGGDAIDGERNAALCEHPPQPPEAGACAIFIDRLHVQVTLANPRLGSDDFGQEGLRCSVTMEDVVLAALFIVQHKLYSGMCTTRPLRVRNGPAIALHVTRIVIHSSPPR